MRRDRKPRHLYELLRPELVKSYPKPLSSDALTGWGTHDPENCKIHNAEVRIFLAQIIFGVANTMTIFKGQRGHAAVVFRSDSKVR